MTMPIYVFGQAHSAANMLNSIAIFAQSAGYQSLQVMFGLIGVVMLAIRFLASGDYMKLFAWAAMILVVDIIFLGFTTSVEVIDLSDQSSFQSVDGVPIGLAFIASEASQISYGLSKDVAFSYQAPKDQEYTQTGFMFGSKLTDKTLAAQLIDPDVVNEWNHYTAQCIIPDIALARYNPDKYTMKELANSPDIFQFLASHHPSPLRGLLVNGEFKTCMQALPMLKEKFDEEASQHITFLGKSSYPNRQNIQKNLSSIIQNTYNYMYGTGKTAIEHLNQSMAINGIKNGLDYNTARDGNAASALNYSTVMTQNSQTAKYLTAGEYAETFIPEFQVVLFILMLSIFPMIILFGFIPEVGITVIKQWLIGVVFLAFLPATFTIIHCLMMTMLSNGTSAISNLYQGVTLSSLKPLQYENTKFASIAGYLLSLSVFLTYILVKGLASGLVSLSQSLNSMVNGDVGENTRTEITGNNHLNNGSFNNLNYGNIGANKHDINPTNMSHKETHDTENGNIIENYKKGSNIKQANSSMWDTLSTGKQITSGLDQSRTQNITATKNDQASLGESAVQRDSDQASLADRINNDQTFRTGMSTQDQASFMKAQSSNESIIENVMKQNGWNRDQAVKSLNNVGLEGHAGLSAFGTGATVKVGHSNDASNSSSSSTSGHDQHSLQMQKQYQENQQIMQTATSHADFSNASGEGKSMTQNLNSDYATTQEAQSRVSADLAQQSAINNAIKHTDTESASINENANHKIWNSLATQYGQTRANEIMSAPDGTADAKIKHDTEGQYISNEVANIKARYGIKTNTFSPNQIQRTHQQEVSGLTTPTVNTSYKDAIHNTHHQSQSALNNKATTQGVVYSDHKGQILDGNVTGSLAKTTDHVTQAQDDMRKKHDTLKNTELDGEKEAKHKTSSILTPSESNPESNALRTGLKVINTNHNIAKEGADLVKDSYEWVKGKL